MKSKGSRCQNHCDDVQGVVEHEPAERTERELEPVNRNGRYERKPYPALGQRRTCEPFRKTFNQIHFDCQRKKKKPVPLDALFVRVNKIHERLDIIPVCETRLFLSHLEPCLPLGVILLRSAEHTLLVRGFHRFGLVNIPKNPVADLSISNRLSNDLNELFNAHAGRFQPQTVKSFAEVPLVIGMKFARKLKADFVNKTR